MLQSYDDIMEIALLARRNPVWWDENGAPRFAEHHPSLCPDIYATEVLLLRIGCQSCMVEFEVQMSWSASTAFLARAKAFALAGVTVHHKEEDVERESLSARVREGTIHFGDPPVHDCGGDTMNCDDYRVLQFWSRRRPVTGSSDWQRIADLEIALPDTVEPGSGGTK